MGRNRITIDLAQCEVFNHLPPNKAGILIKAVMSYCTTGVVASWGEDVDLKPIFMSFRATLKTQVEEYEEKCRRLRENGRKGGEANGSKWKQLLQNASKKETESEREREKEKVTQKVKEQEEGKGEEKDLGCINTSSSSPEGDDPKCADKNKKNLEKRRLANAIIDYYNEQVTARGAKLQFCKARTERRLSSIMARLQEYGEESLKQTIDKAIGSRFLNYEATNAPVSLEWIMKPNNCPKVMEGTYDDRDHRQQQQRTPHGTSVGERAYNMLHFANEGHPERWIEEEKLMNELQKYQ